MLPVSLENKIWDILNSRDIPDNRKIILIRANLKSERSRRISLLLESSKRELLEHIKHRRIIPMLAEEARELYDKKIPFEMLYNNSRNHVFGVRIKKLGF